MTLAPYETALTHFESGRHAEAERACHNALAYMPGNPAVLHLLSRIRLGAGDADEAVVLLREACAVGTQTPEALICLGRALASLDCRAEAEAVYRAALRLDRNATEAYYHLAVLFEVCGDPEAALLAYRETLALAPDHVGAHCRLGSLLLGLGQPAQSLASYNRALEIDPESAEAYVGLGRLLQRVERIADAEAHFRWALELDPDHAGAHYGLSGVFFYRGQLDQVRCSCRRAIELRPRDPALTSGFIFSLNYDPDVTTQEIYTAHLHWAKTYAPAPLRLRFSNDRTTERRLRVGYVSGDFREHAVNHFLEPTLAAHDHEAVEVFCYSNNSSDDELTSRLRRLVDKWIPIAKYSDRQAADCIYQDGIDILVDLSGHTSRNRLELFALKPAPVQVSWLGYLNTTGLRTIDYRITDAIADPPGEADRFYSERLFQLDRCHVCFRPREAQEPVPGLPALRENHVTFGCLHNTCKVSSSVVEAWSKTLHAAPGSRLVFTASRTRDRSIQKHYTDLFAATGIAPERIGFSPAERIDYSAVAEHIDIALDPFPYNGSTTTCETLWSGIPLVTLRGKRHAGRVSASILSTIGLGDLIAEDIAQYIAIAAGLAGDLLKLETLRSEMRARIQASPLHDERGFSRTLEEAYRTMWRSYCKRCSDRTF